MLKLLLVDDEQPILDGLKQLIDWPRIGVCDIKTATNGREALSVIYYFKPDIIITDIKMPFMNGLELIRTVKEELPETKCIVLCGYQDFEYARQAMKYGAVRYLVKPVEEEELIEIIEDISESMLNTSQEKERLEDLNRKLIESEPFLRNKLLYDIVSGETTDICDAFSKLKRLGIRKFPRKFICAILEFEITDDSTGGFTGEDLELVRFGVANIADELICSKAEGLVFYMLKKQIIMLVDVSSCSPHILETLLKDIIYQISKYLNILVTIGVSSIHNSIEDAPKAFKQAKSALRYKLLIGWGKVINYNDVASNINKGIIIPVSVWKKLENSIITGDSGNIPDVIAELFNELKLLKGVDPTELLDKCRDELLLIRRSIEGIGFEDNLLKDFIDEFDQKMYIVTLDELEAQFIDVFQRLAKDIFQTNSLGVKSVISQIKQYIDQNYTGNITLNTLSEKFYVNSSYVSRLFKQELGENFVDYLTGKRMKEAIKLLRNTEMHVYEISENIGYGNPKYFSQLFKKHTGMSPREYRDQK